jgi:hypothetical protein
MSNPFGTDRGEGEHANDPITEVIHVADMTGSADPTGERRYTAPGFDAGSTQIIDRVPEADTEMIAAPQPRTATPQAIAPQPGFRRRPAWLLPAVLAVGVLTAAAILGVVLVRYTASSKLSQQQDMVRAAITTFDTAVRNGDLATLRGVTCGQTRENYVDYDDRSWADTYSRVLAAQQYPVVASVDEVIVNGDHAEANVTSYMAFDPSITSTRSFDLQFRDEQWKICQSA